MQAIREAAVAGQFYPGDADELGATVRALLDEVGAPSGPPAKALIVPHAGYIYSGPVAAHAYGRLRPHRDRYERVVLLGPCHRLAVRGLALSSAAAFRTPLGDVPVDHEFAADLDLPASTVFDATHQLEHSLEVHLPFLQIVLGDFSLVPIVVGDAAPATVAEALDKLWGGPETLIVVSSDLSHYLPYEEARATDLETCRSIERLDPSSLGHHDACGCTPIAGLLIHARRLGLSISTLDLRNSGDTAGPKDAVVGYGAWMLAG